MTHHPRRDDHDVAAIEVDTPSEAIRCSLLHRNRGGVAARIKYRDDDREAQEFLVGSTPASDWRSSFVELAIRPAGKLIWPVERPPLNSVMAIGFHAALAGIESTFVDSVVELGSAVKAGGERAVIVATPSLVNAFIELCPSADWLSLARLVVFQQMEWVKGCPLDVSAAWISDEVIHLHRHTPESIGASTLWDLWRMNPLHNACRSASGQAFTVAEIAEPTTPCAETPARELQAYLRSRVAGIGFVPSGGDDGAALLPEALGDRLRLDSWLCSSLPAGPVMTRSSGTSGFARNIERLTQSLCAEGEALYGLDLARRLNIRPGGKHLMTGPPSSGAHWGVAALAMSCACEIIYCPTSDPEAISSHLDEGINSVFLVPQVLWRVSRWRVVHERPCPESLNTVIHSTAPCPEEWKRTGISAFPGRVVEYYASAEAFISIVSDSDWLRHPGTVGRAIPGTTVTVVNDAGAELPDGEVGRLIVESMGSRIDMRDLAHLENGWIFLHGRADDVINIAGIKVVPSDVEVLLRNLPGIQDAAVVDEEHRVLGRRLHALLVIDEGYERPTLSQLRRELRRNLTREAMPGSIEIVGSLPRDIHGKLRRIELPKRTR